GFLGQGARGPGQAEVPAGDRSAADRDLVVLAEPWRIQRRESGRDPDHGVPPALVLLRRGERLDRQLRPLAAMALGGPDAPPRILARRQDARHAADEVA